MATDANGNADVNLRRETALTVSANVFMVASRLGIATLITGAYGPDTLGLYAFILGVSSVVAKPITSSGVAVRKRLSEPTTTAPRVVGVALLGLLGLTALATTGIVSTGALSHLLPLGTQTGQVLCAMFIGYIWLEVGNHTLVGIGHPGRAMWIEAARDVLILGTTALTIHVLAGDIFLVVWYRVGIYIALGLVSFWLAGIRPARPRLETVRSLAAFARWNVPAKVVGLAVRRAPPIILASVATAMAAGYYKAGVDLTKFAPYMAVAVANPLFVKVSHRVEQGDPVGDYISQATTYITALTVPLLFILVGFGDLLLRYVFGASMVVAAPVVMLLAVERFITGLGIPAEAAVFAADSPKAVFLIRAAEAVLIVPGLVVAATVQSGVPVLATAVYVAGMCLTTIGIYAVATREFETLPTPWSVGQLVGLGAIGLLPGLGLRVVAGSSVLVLVTGIALFGAWYLASLTTVFDISVTRWGRSAP